VAALSGQKAKRSGRLILILLGLFIIACFAGALYLGDLAKFQESIFAKESSAALQGVNDPQQLDRLLKQYPSNKTMKLLALARKDAVETDAATQRLLNDTEPASLSRTINLTSSSRGDLDAVLRDLKIAQNNAATFKTRYAALIKARRDETESAANALNLASDTVARFMAMIDEQHAEMTALTAKVLAARAEHHAAYEKCTAILIKELDFTKVAEGQLVFRLRSTANSYNAAAATMAAAAKRLSELEDERTSLRQVQFKRWKDFASQ